MRLIAENHGVAARGVGFAPSSNYPGAADSVVPAGPPPDRQLFRGSPCPGTVRSIRRVATIPGHPMTIPCPWMIIPPVRRDRAP